MIQTSSAVDNFYITEDVKNTPSRSKNVDEETDKLADLLCLNKVAA